MVRGVINGDFKLKQVARELYFASYSFSVCIVSRLYLWCSVFLICIVFVFDTVVKLGVRQLSSLGILVGATNTKPQQGNQTVHFISVQIFSSQMSSFGPRLLAGSLIEFSFVFWNKCKTVSTNIKPQQGNETVHFILHLKCKLSCQIELWFATAPESFGILSDCHCCYYSNFLSHTATPKNHIHTATQKNHIHTAT